MSYVAQDEKLWHVVQSLVEEEGLILYDLEKIGRSGIRVVIDRNKNSTAEGSAQGVRSQDCAKLCRRFMTYFLVEGESLQLTSEPEVEVSSPGVNRNLRLSEHFVSALGQRVRIDSLEEIFTTAGESIGKRWLVGELKQVNKNELLLVNEENGQECNVKFFEIKKARIDFKF